MSGHYLWVVAWDFPIVNKTFFLCSEFGQHFIFYQTGAIEGQHFRKTRELVSLSEQQLVDCSKENKGCHGGVTSRAMLYVKQAKGIEGEADYKYTAEVS